MPKVLQTVDKAYKKSRARFNQKCAITHKNTQKHSVPGMLKNFIFLKELGHSGSLIQNFKIMATFSSIKFPFLEKGINNSINLLNKL